MRLLVVFCGLSHLCIGCQEHRLLAAVRDNNTQVRIVERLDAPVFQVIVDARKAADVGVTVGNVALAIASLTGGPSAWWTDPRSGERIQLAGGSIEDLKNVTTPLSRNATTIPLGNLISVRQSLMPLEIDHVNLLPVVRAEFLVDRQTRKAAASKLAAAIRDIDLPQGSPMIELRTDGYAAAR
jgi:multidrug efflux pump subunit AcrB